MLCPTATVTTLRTGTGTDTETGTAPCTGQPVTDMDSSTMHCCLQGPTLPPTWTASRLSLLPCCVAECAMVADATTAVRRETSPQSTVTTRSNRTSSSSQTTRASDSSSVRYPALMEDDASAGTSAGVHQTPLGSFATCQPRPLLDPTLQTRMPTTRVQNLPLSPCILYHCPTSKCPSTHPW